MANARPLTDGWGNAHTSGSSMPAGDGSRLCGKRPSAGGPVLWRAIVVGAGASRAKSHSGSASKICESFVPAGLQTRAVRRSERLLRRRHLHRFRVPHPGHGQLLRRLPIPPCRRVSRPATWPAGKPLSLGGPAPTTTIFIVFGSRLAACPTAPLIDGHGAQGWRSARRSGNRVLR
jgi:hypothetical protein